MEEQIKEVGSLVYTVLFLPKINERVKNYLKEHYFEEEELVVPENMVLQYNLKVSEKLIRESNLNPDDIIDFLTFTAKCQNLDISYFEF